MRILLIEDYHFHADLIASALEKGFPGMVVERLATEHAFRRWLASPERSRPDLIVMDVMLRWADPVPQKLWPDAPTDVREEGLTRAGLRCRDLLQAEPQTRGIPVLLYTIREKAGVMADASKQENLFYLKKEADPQPLVQAVREILLKRNASW